MKYQKITNLLGNTSDKVPSVKCVRVIKIVKLIRFEGVWVEK